jgi:hypothetical protein
LTAEIFLQHTPGISEALDRAGDPATVADVVGKVVAQRAQAWGDERALIITQVTKPYVHFWIATGELEAVKKLSHEILKWAEGLGCTRATLTGRRGWVRALRDEGWRERAVLLEKVINGNG